MSYITDYQYYENGGVVPEDANWGSYQYVTLDDIVNNFTLMYQGNNELINNIERYQILFHAKRGIQELNYDAMKEIKILQLQIDSQLRFILPQDYVNWVRISQYTSGQVLIPLTENIQTNWSGAYLQDNNYKILFDIDGNVLKPNQSKLTIDRIAGTAPSIYTGGGAYDGQSGYNIDGCWYFDYGIGARFGMNTETANSNPTFSIDKKGGVINFSSGLEGEFIVLEYVSDGLESGDDSSVSVNKMFEEFLYAYIKYSILNSKLGVQEYVINRARKDKSSLLRNAKLRLSNIHPGRLLMNMRGKDKWLK
jgi:hypothetical protein|tara:strand:+ start:2810 stop:3733 length:924 start_codon:yes stop_codon:yes gene_type:complete